jgi:hypothetical protein
MIADMVARSDGFGTADFLRSLPTKNNVSLPQMFDSRRLICLCSTSSERLVILALAGDCPPQGCADHNAWKRWKIKGIDATDDGGEGEPPHL